MALNLPPYGFMNQENISLLKKTPMPLGFTCGGQQATEQQYEAWLVALAKEMADFLWPIYEPGRGWVGAAEPAAEDLTRADLNIMQQLLPMHQQPIDGGTAVMSLHADAWKREDDFPPGPSFDAYGRAPIPTFYETQDSELARGIFKGGRELAKPLSQRLKDKFQRPRASQVALMWWDGDPQKKWLLVQASKSAITPSMISGHCIQGTMALASAYARCTQFLEGTPLLTDLQRFLIDSGDRRVYAGLHYPSDNAGSWFAALRLCEPIYVSRAPEIRGVLWRAIQESKVFHKMAATGGVYDPILKKLALAAAGE